MPARPFEYVVVRLVPRVDREEFLNVGVIVFCRQARYLGARIEPDLQRLRALAPQTDWTPILAHLDLLRRIAAGGPEAAPIGLLERAERYRWLAAPRSAVIQASPPHCGQTSDPAATLERLFDELVACPPRGQGEG